MTLWLTFDAPVVVGAALVVVTGAALVVGVLEVEPEFELAAVRFFVGDVVVGGVVADDVVAGALGLVGFAEAIDPSVIFAGTVWKLMTPKRPAMVPAITIGDLFTWIPFGYVARIAAPTRLEAEGFVMDLLLRHTQSIGDVDHSLCEAIGTTDIEVTLCDSWRKPIHRTYIDRHLVA